jgi:hypothetical protein
MRDEIISVHHGVGGSRSYKQVKFLLSLSLATVDKVAY